MNYVDEDGEEEEFSEEDFDVIIKKFKLKNKKAYDFIVKSGSTFKRLVSKLCLRVLNKEEIPKSFDLTTLIQIYKGKGPRQILSNNRFIHTKSWIPRLCEAMVVERMKPVITEKVSMFQIGGMPGRRSSEHLFVLKSIIALYALLGLVIIV